MSKETHPKKRVIGFVRKKIPGTHLEDALQPLFEGEERNEEATKRKIVGFKPTKIADTELAGPDVPIFEDEEIPGQDPAV